MNTTSEIPRSALADAVRAAALLAALEQVQAVIEFDLEGKVVRANRLFLDLMGYSAEEVVGQHHRIFCPSEVTNSEGYRAFWQGLIQGGMHEGIFMRSTKSGRQVWLQASYSPVRDTEGRTVGVLKLAKDITAHRAEQAAAQGMVAAIHEVQAVIEF
ncbi:MAG: PAS domain S-box protein, partial [Comamonas sp.]